MSQIVGLTIFLDIVVVLEGHQAKIKINGLLYIKFKLLKTRN